MIELNLLNRIMFDADEDSIDFSPNERLVRKIRRRNLKIEKNRRKARHINKRTSSCENNFPKSRYFSFNRHAGRYKSLSSLNDITDVFSLIEEDLGASLSDILDYSQAVLRMCHNTNKNKDCTVPWRSRSDRRPNASKKYQNKTILGPSFKKYQNRKGEKSRFSDQTTNRTRRKPFQQVKKMLQKNINIQSSKKNQEEMPKAYDIPLEIRTIFNQSGLYTAYEFISARKAKAGYFKHPNKQVNEAVQIILGYVQSRIDRGLEVNINELITGNNQVVNNRLLKWEARYKKRIISVPMIFSGKFYKPVDDVKGSKYSFIPFDTKILVSSNYSNSPERYVTSQKELLKAVRRALKGQISDLSSFNILDPVSMITLEFCFSIPNNGKKYLINPNNIARLKSPELISMLEQNGLTDSNGNPLKYHFFFSHDEYRGVYETSIRIAKLKIADDIRSRKAGENKRILTMKQKAHAYYRSF